MAFSNRPYNPSVDYFAVLGVHHQACKKTVKTAYRRLARRYHPDVSAIHDAKEKFQEVSEAYEVLSKHRDSYWREFQLSVRNRTSRSGFKWNRSSDSRSQRSTTQNRKSRQSHRSYRAYQPIDGKDRCITYPLTLRYAIRLLKLGSFYIPGLKVKMKFTCEALQGKTFRLAGKGYKGLYGGKPGDFLVRFEIKNEKIQWELKGSDIYGTFQVTPHLLNAGSEIKLESPSGVCSVEVPHGYCSEQFLCIKNMGLPSCVTGQSGHLYARLVAA